MASRSENPNASSWRQWLFGENVVRKSGASQWKSHFLRDIRDCRFCAPDSLHKSSTPTDSYFLARPSANRRCTFSAAAFTRSWEARGSGGSSHGRSATTTPRGQKQCGVRGRSLLSVQYGGSHHNEANECYAANSQLITVPKQWISRLRLDNKYRCSISSYPRKPAHLRGVG